MCMGLEKEVQEGEPVDIAENIRGLYATQYFEPFVGVVENGSFRSPGDVTH